MTDDRTGNQFLLMLSALANPHRLRILAALSVRQAYVSELARELKSNTARSRRPTKAWRRKRGTGKKPCRPISRNSASGPSRSSA